MHLSPAPPLSVLTAMFLHGSWLHLLGNMLFLLIFGNNVEDRMGHIRFTLFYVVCGYAASYGFALLNDDSADPLTRLTGTLAGQIVMEGFLNIRVRPWLRRLVTRLLAIVPALAFDHLMDSLSRNTPDRFIA